MKHKKKVFSFIFFTCILVYGYYELPIKYLGISAPTEEACNICGDPKGEMSYVSYTKTISGDIKNIKFDTYSSVYNGSKIAYSEAGLYGLKDDPNGGGIKWSEHIAKLEDYVIENDAMPRLNDEGRDVDGVSGATIKIDSMSEAYKNAKPKLQIRLFDKENFSLYKDLLIEE